LPAATSVAPPGIGRGTRWSERAAGRPLLLIAMLVAASLASRWLSLIVDVIDLDETAHVVGSWEILRGSLLYRDFVDNKPPLLYTYYLVAQALFGRGLLAVHVFTAVISVPATALGLAWFLRFSRSGMVAALAFVIYSASFLAHDMLASHAELPMCAVGIWSLVLLRDQASAVAYARLFGAGAFAGVAMLFKQQAAAWLAGLIVVVLWRSRHAGMRRRLMAVGTLVAGFCLPLAATWSWFAARDAHDELFYWALVNNFAYAANPISWREAGERALSYLVPFALVTAPLWWGAWKGRHRWADPHQRLIVWATLVSTIPTAALGFRFFPHYFIQLYPPLVLAAAPWLTDTLNRRGVPARALIGWSVFVLAGFQVVNAWLYLGPVRVYRERDPVFRQVAQRLHRDPCAATGSLFVWGYAPIFYYYADLPAASRFVVLAQGNLTGYISGNLESVRGRQPAAAVSAANWDLLMRDLDTRRATFILDTAPAGIYRWNQYPIERFPRLQRYVQEQFEPIDEIDHVVVYRRRGCEGRNR
jgi:hypothetical protein